jgi:hypothetical protein
VFVGKTMLQAEHRHVASKRATAPSLTWIRRGDRAASVPGAYTPSPCHGPLFRLG